MSFSSEIKLMLSSLPIKKNCCKKALLLGLLCAHSDIENQSLAFYTDNEKVSTLAAWAFRQCYGLIPYYETSSVIPNVISYYKMKDKNYAKDIK